MEFVDFRTSDLERVSSPLRVLPTRVLWNVPSGTTRSETPGMLSMVPSSSTVACVKYAARNNFCKVYILEMSHVLTQVPLASTFISFDPN